MKDTIILLQAMKERLTEQKSIGSVDIDIINQAIKELKALEILKKHIRIVKPFDLETKKEEPFEIFDIDLWNDGKQKEDFEFVKEVLL